MREETKKRSSNFENGILCLMTEIAFDGIRIISVFYSFTKGYFGKNNSQRMVDDGS